MSKKLVNFTLDNEDFGFKINEVLEIIPYRDTVTLPGSHQDLDGVVNIRGEVVPVLSLRKKLDLEVQEASKHSRIVLVETQHGKLGLKVDSVKNVIELEDDRIADVPGIMNHMNVNYLDAFGKINSHLMIMVDLEGLFSDYSLEKVVSSGNMSVEKLESIKEKQVEDAKRKTQNLKFKTKDAKNIKTQKAKKTKKANRKKTKSKKITGKSKEEKNSNIVCRVCEKEFMNERGLKIHTTKVHSK